MPAPIVPNLTARRLFLHRHALAEAPTGAVAGEDLARLIRRIGFVQVDSITTVERAHHMILFSRRQSYRPAALKPLLERDRRMWEHWTHDASILPVETFPYWKHRFADQAARLAANAQRWLPEDHAAQFDTILNRIARDGPLTAFDAGAGEARGTGGWWDWHPSKLALEWLWRTGRLAITSRAGFQKVYDLTERVIPAPHYQAEVSFAEKVDWACSSALERLGFASPAEIQAYWNAVAAVSVRDWVAARLAEGSLTEIQIEGADGSLRRALARADVLDATPPEPPARLRVLSPFDPALRDRKRAEFLFGFYYRIEVFTPEAKRRWGYYVFPLLEGDRLVGRLDAKAHRSEGVLRLRAFWPEAGIRLTQARIAKLEAELHRLARFADCAHVEYLPGWLRDHIRP